MQRIAVGIEYDGSLFSGWQLQDGLATVQGELERALSRVADEPLALVAAGRTDAGVHATGQIAHFDTAAARSPRAWTLGANTYLPGSVSILWALAVPDYFHARYSAEARTYRYLILNRTARPALAARRITWIPQRLDHESMEEAARALVGEHDFSSFRSIECQSRTPRRRVERFTVERTGDVIALEVTANAFLHHMVRNLAGLLIAIGRGDLAPADVGVILAARDRGRAPATAPPDGLYLAAVRYPEAFRLPVAPLAALRVPAPGDPL